MNLWSRTPLGREATVTATEPADDSPQDNKISRHKRGGGNYRRGDSANNCSVSAEKQRMDQSYCIRYGSSRTEFCEDHSLPLHPITSVRPARTAVGNNHHVR